MLSIKNTLLACAATLSVTFAGGAQAQQQSVPTPVATMQVPADDVEMGGPALWRIADFDTEIYLFGTVHALPEGMNWYNRVIARALKSSDTIVFEIPMADGNEAEIQQYTLSKGLLPSDTTLRSLMDDEQRATYEKGLAGLGIPAAAFDKFKPWLTAMTISMLPLMREGYKADQGVEKQLEKLAGPEVKREALETIEFQIGVFNDMDEAAQVKYLIETSASLDEIKPTLDAMVDNWRKGDVEGLGTLMNASMSDPVVAEALLYSRNANWVEWIDERLDTPGTVFIAVGAGHLAGKKSVQELLAERDIHSLRLQ